jgi:hypothetical protein
MLSVRGWNPAPAQVSVALMIESAQGGGPREAPSTSPGKHRRSWEPPSVKSDVPPLEYVEDGELLDRLGRVGAILSDPLAIRIVSLLMVMGQSSPSITAALLRESPADVAHKYSELLSLGALEPRGWLAERGAFESSASLTPALREALPEAIRELGFVTDRGPNDLPPRVLMSAPVGVLGQTYYHLLRSKGDALRDYAGVIQKLGEALSHPGRVKILLYLALHEQGKTGQITAGIGRAGNINDQRFMERHLGFLETCYSIRECQRDDGSAWTITEPMRSVLGGFHDYLIAINEFTAAGVTNELGGGSSGEAD